MTIRELGNELNDIYTNLGEKVGKVASIHLFGIKYGVMIKENGYKPVDIIKISGIHSSYITELGKGIKLSSYVTINENLK